MFYPAAEVLRPITFEAPPPRLEHAGANLPVIVLLRSQQLPLPPVAGDTANPEREMSSASGETSVSAAASASEGLSASGMASASGEAPPSDSCRADDGTVAECLAGSMPGGGEMDGGQSGGEGRSVREGRARRRLHLEMRFPSAAWGVLNVTGPLQGWSYTAQLSPAPIPGVGHLPHLLRRTHH